VDEKPFFEFREFCKERMSAAIWTRSTNDPAERFDYKKKNAAEFIRNIDDKQTVDMGACLNSFPNVVLSA